MISRAQQILVKRAQREAALCDEEYREALELVSGCRSTIDPRMTDRGVDLVLGYFEAIYWRKVDSQELQPVCRADAVFRQRGYWAQKNSGGQTSRDRFLQASVDGQINALESEMAGLGFGRKYCSAIRSKVTHGRNDPDALHRYKAALRRTLESKRKKADCPF